MKKIKYFKKSNRYNLRYFLSRLFIFEKYFKMYMKRNRQTNSKILNLKKKKNNIKLMKFIQNRMKFEERKKILQFVFIFY